MTDSLNVVTVRPNDEGRVVIGVIVRPNPWRAVVFASGSESLTIDLVYLTAIVCRESDVQWQRLTFCGAEPKGRLLRPPKSGGVRKFHHNSNPLWRKRLKEEGLACFEIAHTNTNVIKHGSLVS